VGLPNAGKSTFINAVSNANAKVGAYPFTTVRPQLGVATHRQREFVVADIPGLIEGAADGAGIGDRFLGHIERCRVLLHLVDASGDDPIDAWHIVNEELHNYGSGLEDKPQILALNKIDALPEKEVAKLAKKLAKASGSDVMLLSGAAGTGLEPVLDAIVAALGPAPDKGNATTDTGDHADENAVAWSPI